MLIAEFCSSAKSVHDDAWKELFNSKVLRPFETQEFLDNLPSSFPYEKEQADAEEALNSATTAVLATYQAYLYPQHFKPPQKDQEPLERLTAAQSEVATAKGLADPIRK